MVLLITLDGLRSDHLSCFGAINPTSPTIDAFAQKGLAFRSLVTPGLSTKTAMTSLFTGVDFRFHHIEALDAALPDEYVTLAEVFKQGGYYTAGFIGNPHFPRETQYHQGFYEYFDHKEISEYHPRAKRVIQRVLEFVDRYVERSDRPNLFIQIHLFEPHSPWLDVSDFPGPPDSLEGVVAAFNHECTYIPPADEYAAMTPEQFAHFRNRYDAAIRSADAEIGTLIAKLEEHDLLGRALVAFSTDHGYQLGERFAFNHDRTPFNEVATIPFILCDNDTPLPRIDTSAVRGRTMDIGATLLARAGLTIPETWEGIDLLNQAERLPRYRFSYGPDTSCVFDERYKLIRFDEWTAREGRTLRERSDIYPAPGYHLYDLWEDPGETHNIVMEQPRIYRQLRQQLDAYHQDLAREFIPGKRVPLDSKTEDALRDLGYIGP